MQKGTAQHLTQIHTKFTFRVNNKSIKNSINRLCLSRISYEKEYHDLEPPYAQNITFIIVLTLNSLVCKLARVPTMASYEFCEISNTMQIRGNKKVKVHITLCMCSLHRDFHQTIHVVPTSNFSVSIFDSLSNMTITDTFCLLWGQCPHFSTGSAACGR